MSSSTCYDLHQDAQGFIWIATNTGLDRFDGSDFYSFTEKDGFSGSLVRRIAEDDVGRIWLSTYFDGFFYTSGSPHSSFQPYEHNAVVQSMGPGPLDFTVDQEAGLTMDYATRNVTEVAAEKPIAHNYYQPGVVFHLSAHKRSYSGLGAPIHTLVSVTKKDSQVWELSDGALLQSFPLYVDSNSLFLGNYLVVWNEEGLHLDTLPGVVNSFKVLADGDYLLGTSRGLWRYHEKDGTSQLLIPDIVVYDILVDGQKNVWVASRASGLFKIPSLKVLTYPVTEGFGTQLIGFSTGDTNRVCVHSESAVFEKKKGVQGFQEVFKIDQPEIKIRDVLEHPSSDDQVLICNLGHPNIWRIRGDVCLTKHHFPLTHQIHHGRFRGESLFLTGSGGAYQYDLDTDSAKALQPDSVVILCHSLEMDSKGKFWYGGMGSIYRETAQGLVPVFELTSLVMGLDFCQGSLVVATQKQGLYLLDTASGALTNIRKEDGLTTDVLSSLLVQGNRIWIASAKGVNLVEKREGEWVVGTPYISSVLNYGLVRDLAIRNHKLWLCLPHKVVSVPLQSTFPQHPFPVQITAWQVNGEAILSSETSFAHGQNEVAVHFTEPNFLNLSGDKYLYRLAGTSNQAWTSTSAKQLTFPSLQPGSYEFQIQSKPSLQEAEVPQISKWAFSIEPPFWRTWWFIGIELLVLLLLVYSIVKYRSRQIANREVLKTELVRLELKALKAQINPHFVYNAISSVQYYLAKNQPLEAQQYMSDFAHLIRKVLEHSDKSLIPLDSELDLIRNYVDLESKKFEGEGLCLQQELADDIHGKEVRIPPALFQPFVENAIFHGLKSKVGPRKLVLRVYKKQKRLVVEIEDNGVGRKKAEQQPFSRHKGPSFGISIASERIQVLNGAKSAESVTITDLVGSRGEALGTRVVLFIPYISIAS